MLYERIKIIINCFNDIHNISITINNQGYYLVSVLTLVTLGRCAVLVFLKVAVESEYFNAGPKHSTFCLSSSSVS